MKKRVYNLLFIILLSISFLGVANASTIKIDRAVSNENGVIYFLSNDAEGVKGLVCKNKKGENVKIKSNKEQELDTGIFMSIEGGQYKISATGQKDNSNITLKCTYEEAPWYLTNEGTAGSGELTIALHFTDNEKRSFDYTFSMNTLSNHRKRITGPNTPFSIFESENFEYKSCEADNKYLTCSKDIDGVQVKVVDGLDLTEPVTTDVLVTFLNKDDNQD